MVKATKGRVTVSLRVFAPAWVPVESIEILVDGKAVRTFAVQGKPKNGERFATKVTLTLEHRGEVRDTFELLRFSRDGELLGGQVGQVDAACLAVLHRGARDVVRQGAQGEGDGGRADQAAHGEFEGRIHAVTFGLG